MALKTPRQDYTFAELEAQAERVARYWLALGLEPGDRVILCLEEKDPFLLAHLGSLWLGAVPVPLNPAFTAAELSYYARDCRAALIVCDEATRRKARDVSDLLDRQILLVDSVEVLKEDRPVRLRAPELQADSPALMLYSSGTTGKPKGVVHTQGNLLAAVEAIRSCWRFEPGDTLANVLPLFHIHGLSFAAHVSLLAGSTMVIEQRFHPVRCLNLIRQATVFMGVPTYYYALLKRQEFRQARAWRHLRLVTCGSAPIRPEVLPQLESILNQPIINRYGMTEAHVLTSLPLDGPWPNGSVGCALDGVEIALRDDSGRNLPDDTVGVVWARGPNLFKEYWDRPDDTANCFDQDAWFDTGDLAKRDCHGFLTLVGRQKDLIIVGGFNVYPAVVERVLAQCPGVVECAVVGLPDEYRGERVAAFVVTDSGFQGKAKLQEFCRKRLADYQCPKRIEVLPELPRNAMGKILKTKLRLN